MRNNRISTSAIRRPNATAVGRAAPAFDVRTPAIRPGIVQGESFPYTPEGRSTQHHVRKPLRVLKFGGTSVGDAARIVKVAEIIRGASLATNVVVVVSAMSGVTNKLIEAAKQAEMGNSKQVNLIFQELRNQHSTTAEALIHSTAERKRVTQKLREIFEQGEQLCQGITLVRELTARAADSIAGIGERLSIHLVGAALSDQGLACEAIEATELIVTDACHGSAEPQMQLTYKSCESRLRPLIHRGVIPVVTGYIAATTEGVLTTLGRGGSDYSATVIGAALDVEEVIIWTDVDGVLTADPKVVPDVSTIPEISYREASELAFFGAKVLHPKTLRPVMQSNIPVWIRNTFAPHKQGTKITLTGSKNGGRVKALTSITDVALITVGGPSIVGARDVLGRTFTTTAAMQADVLLVSQSSSQNEICFCIPSACADRTIEALRREFAPDLGHETVEHIRFNPDIAIISAVGENMRSTPAIVGRILAALNRENVNLIAIAQGSSETNVCLLVPRIDMKRAVIAAHREFQLCELSAGHPLQTSE